MKNMVTRGQICDLLGLTSTNLDNLVRNNQFPLAFGLQAPAARGEYHVLDVFANKFADALVERGFPRETATAILRDHHETWLLGLTRAEWEPSGVMYKCRHEVGQECRREIAKERMIYLAVAREKDAKSGRESFHVAQGLPAEAMAALNKALGEKPAADMVFIRILDVLNDTFDAFEETGLFEWLMEGKPDVFTRPRSHAEFPEWRAEIERVRQQSVDRLKMRDRVKRAVRQAKRQREVA